jgi:hypothetical protein
VEDQTSLSEVQEAGRFLVLLDGRQLEVNPGDIPTVATWYPTMNLTISMDHSDTMFPVIIRNMETDQEIKAMWIIWRL